MSIDKSVYETLLHAERLHVPTIGVTYRLGVEAYQCYDVHATASYGNGMLTVTATYRKKEDKTDGETD